MVEQEQDFFDRRLINRHEMFSGYSATDACRCDVYIVGGGASIKRALGIAADGAFIGPATPLSLLRAAAGGSNGSSTAFPTWLLTVRPTMNSGMLENSGIPIASGPSHSVLSQEASKKRAIV